MAQRVAISSRKSIWRRPITRSVPQGPILFNIFVHDLNDRTEGTLNVKNQEELVVLPLKGPQPRK